ncbi:putative xanthine dehydrogenase subunit A [Maioricimonas rarisocia]|uniref:Putative xanthine dehydrogenase subunit A n=1 Tax=Maioricimonas rarisocia TaxID=2528026 RepID=A0A517Z3Z1_9PLAN|nr:XdhC/CoxI family protein [Maioricimonas rarisocia]QDU37147.1 putative xanthine dehydrogenase subunit A [Maioricimonas rarisocia]
MRDVLARLLSAAEAGQPVAYTALVETRGSTPQKAGASMLVFADGSQTGTLGGGCVEAEVKRRALGLLTDGKTELLSFQLDSDYGWDDGLICGGRMQMLVDPLRATDDVAYYQHLRNAVESGTGCTEAVVIDAEKAGLPTGTRLLFDRNGNLLARRGDDGDFSAVVETLRPLSGRPRPYVQGGVSYLPQLTRCRLVIVGAGHVGQAVANLAADVGFDVWMVDDREEYCNPERQPRAERCIVGPIDDVLPGLEITSDTYCIIVTRGHNHDEEALYHLATTDARYVGMIGSKRKIKLIFEDLRREGIAEEQLARVHAPIGFDIGSQTVPEIAVSIVAELVAYRNLPEFQPDSIVRRPLLQKTTD